MIEYKQSKRWDLNISLQELLDFNSDCMININYRKHKSDDCFGRFILLFKHPESNDKYSIQIGIAEDGFVYVGDGNESNCKNISKDRGMRFLAKYGNFMNSVFDFESELAFISEEDCINILYRHNYELANSNVNNTLHFNIR